MVSFNTFQDQFNSDLTIKLNQQEQIKAGFENFKSKDFLTRLNIQVAQNNDLNDLFGTALRWATPLVRNVISDNSNEEIDSSIKVQPEATYEQFLSFKSEIDGLLNRKTKIENEIAAIEFDIAESSEDWKVAQGNDLILKNKQELLEIEEAILVTFKKFPSFTSNPELNNSEEILQQLKKLKAELESQKKSSTETVSKHLVNEGINGIQKFLSEIFANTQPNFQNDLEKIIGKFNEKEIKTEDLSRLFDLLEIQSNYQKSLEEHADDLKDHLKSIITNALKYHPTIAKAIISALALAVGMFLGGPMTAATMQITANRLLENLNPTSQASGQVETIADGLFQAAIGFATGGIAGGITAGAVSSFNNNATGMQKDVATVAAMTYMGGNIGLPTPAAAQMGLIGIFAMKKPYIVQEIIKDLFSVVQVLRKEPMQAPAKFGRFIRKLSINTFTNISKAFFAGSYKEGLVRFALVTVPLANVALGLAGIPLAGLLVFLGMYFADKAFRPIAKFEGPAKINNYYFLEYLSSEYNKISHKGLKPLKELVIKEVDIAEKDKIQQLFQVV